jgi:hypothetical protein
LAVVIPYLPADSQSLGGAGSTTPDQSSPLYPPGSSVSDTAFGAQIGAGSHWAPSPGTFAKSGAMAFTGTARLGCSGVDFNAFLRSFDPHELLSEIRNTLLSGAQAAASNFLVALAYSDPTIVSVLDMMDKKYSSRFSAFSQACHAQAARSHGEQFGAMAMADAADQCFDAEISRGTAPTEAYRRCSIQHQFDGMNLPAAASNADYLRQFTTVPVTADTEALMGLMPDQRIASNSLQLRAPESTVAIMTDRIRIQARTALERIDQGADPTQIATCSGSALNGTSASVEGCLPPGTVSLLATPAFRSASLLGNASRELFKDALASQIAIGAMYANLIELKQQIDRMDVRNGAIADANHAQSRRRNLHAAFNELLQEAESQVKAQEARNEIVRSQILALEKVQSTLNTRAGEIRSDAAKPQFAIRDLVHLFAGSK